jgi:type 1 glutamine amidotransferase
MRGSCPKAGLLPALAVALLATSGCASEEGRKKIVFLAGPDSHGYAQHCHHAGCQLLAQRLQSAMPAGVQTHVVRGWPREAAVLAGAAAIVIYCDAGDLLAQHAAELDQLTKNGAGLACLHYTLDTTHRAARALMLERIGGCFEQHWSVNPTWEAAFKVLPPHPVTRGVRPFTIADEWYFHMRFREPMDGVTPVLTAVPPEITREQPDGPHTGNPAVRARRGMAEHLAWVYQRPDGGRGFGFTGGHSHWNWAHDDYRKLVLNAIAWVAKLEAPPDGIPSKTPSVEELVTGQDRPKPAKWTLEGIQRMIERATGAQAPLK